MNCCGLPSHLLPCSSSSDRWKASSGSQCSKNLTQPEHFLQEFFLLWLPRGGSGKTAEPQCHGEMAGRYKEGELPLSLHCQWQSDGCSRAESTMLEHGCSSGGWSWCCPGSLCLPLPLSPVDTSMNAYAALRWTGSRHWAKTRFNFNLDQFHDLVHWGVREEAVGKVRLLFF